MVVRSILTHHERIDWYGLKDLAKIKSCTDTGREHNSFFLQGNASLVKLVSLQKPAHLSTFVSNFVIFQVSEEQSENDTWFIAYKNECKCINETKYMVICKCDFLRHTDVRKYLYFIVFDNWSPAGLQLDKLINLVKPV